jgi:hypothetical protein
VLYSSLGNNGEATSTLPLPRIAVADAKPTFFVPQVTSDGKETFPLSEIQKWAADDALWRQRMKSEPWSGRLTGDDDGLGKGRQGGSNRARRHTTAHALEPRGVVRGHNGQAALRQVLTARLNSWGGLHSVFR